jgi:AraC-like DNA-binding protein
MTRDANRMTPDATPAARGAIPLLSSNTVRSLLDALGRLGHDVASLMSAANLTSAELADPDGLVPATAYRTILESALRERPRKNLALRVAEVTPIGALPLLDYLVLSSDTAGEGLRRLARYHRLIGSTTPLVLREDEDPIRVVVDCRGFPFVVEFSVALTLIHLRGESDGRARAQWVSFEHRPDDAREMAEALGCPVREAQSWSGFTLSAETWATPMRRRDPLLLSVLERHADAVVARLPASEGATDRVRHALAAGLAHGDATIAAIARALATTPRTLQRRLASEGVSFNDLVDAVRREAAERHLKERVLSISEIAFVLGYSEPAAFHRAFRRWHRRTPQAFRADVASGAVA